jgi:hypothetical protein
MRLRGAFEEKQALSSVSFRSRRASPRLGAKLSGSKAAILRLTRSQALDLASDASGQRSVTRLDLEQHGSNWRRRPRPVDRVAAPHLCVIRRRSPGGRLPFGFASFITGTDIVMRYTAIGSAGDPAIRC